MRKVLILTGLLLACRLSHAGGYMSRAMEWDFRTTGNNNNGGGFCSTATVAGGVDYSQQDSTQAYVEDLECIGNSSAAVISASYLFTAADIGNVINIATSPSAGWTYGRYEIISVVDSTATLHQKCGNYNCVSGKAYLGGALQSPADGNMGGGSGPVVAGGNTIWIKSGTYTAIANINVTLGDTVGGSTKYCGYQTTHGDNPTGDNRPIITMGASYFYGATYTLFRNLQITGTGSFTFIPGAYSTIYNCKISNTSSSSNRVALYSSGNSNIRILNSEITSPLGYGLGDSSASSDWIVAGCHVHNCVRGLNGTLSDIGVYNNIFSSCTTVYYSVSASQNLRFINNTFIGISSGTAYVTNCTNGQNDLFLNNIFYNQYIGITLGNAYASKNTILLNNDYYYCTSSMTATGVPTLCENNQFIDPIFTDEGSINYGIGTGLQADGFPSSYPNSTTNTYIDIGAAQRQQQGGGGGGGGSNNYISFD